MLVSLCDPQNTELICWPADSVQLPPLTLRPHRSPVAHTRCPVAANTLCSCGFRSPPECK